MKLLVAKSKINVSTATDPNDFIFHSDFNTFKIIEEKSFSPILSSEAGEVVYEVENNLGYKPFVFAFCKFTNGRVAMPGTKDSANDFWFSSFNVGPYTFEFGYVNGTGGNYQPTFKYIACEAPATT